MKNTEIDQLFNDFLEFTHKLRYLPICGKCLALDGELHGLLLRFATLLKHLTKTTD